MPITLDQVMQSQSATPMRGTVTVRPRGKKLTISTEKKKETKPRSQGGTAFMEVSEAIPFVGDIQAGIASAVTGKPFSEVKKIAEEKRKVSAAEYPNTALAGQFLGTAMSAGVLAAKAPKIFGLVAPNAPKAVGALQNLGKVGQTAVNIGKSQLGQFGKGAAAYGALEQLSTGDADVMKRIKGVPAAAAVGGTTGVIGAGVLGGIGRGAKGIYQAVTNPTKTMGEFLATPLGQKIFGVSEESIRRLKAAGIEPTVATTAEGDIGNTAMQAMQKIGFGGGKKITEAKTEMERGLGREIKSVAGQYGGSKELQDVGQAVRTGISEKLLKSKAAAGQMLETTQAALGKDSPIVMKNTMSLLESKAIKDLPETQKKIGSPVKAILQGLAKDLEKQSNIDPRTMTRLPASASLGSVKNVAEEIGNLIDSPDAPLAKQAYKAIFDDIEASLINKPKELAAFKVARSNYNALLKQEEKVKNVFAESKLDKNIGKRAVEEIQGGDEMVNALKEVLPEKEFNEIVAGMLQKDFSKAKEGVTSFDPNKFSKFWNKMTDSSKNALFGAKGSAARDKIENIAILSQKAIDNPAAQQSFLATAGLLLSGGVTAVLSPRAMTQVATKLLPVVLAARKLGDPRVIQVFEESMKAPATPEVRYRLLKENLLRLGVTIPELRTGIENFINATDEGMTE